VLIERTYARTWRPGFEAGTAVRLALAVAGTGRDGYLVVVPSALLLVDVIKDFRHEDGERLLASYEARHDALKAVLAAARENGTPVVYANDDAGTWDSDFPRLLVDAVERGRAGDLVASVAPQDGDVVVLKPRYSAFDATPLEMILREQLEVDELLVAGTATEMCVFQTVTDALRLGFSVAVQTDACATVDEEHERLALRYLHEVLDVPLFTSRASSRR
jgi:nicotinamidase-related amidase